MNLYQVGRFLVYYSITLAVYCSRFTGVYFLLWLLSPPQKTAELMGAERKFLWIPYHVDRFDRGYWTPQFLWKGWIVRVKEFFGSTSETYEEWWLYYPESFSKDPTITDSFWIMEITSDGE